MPRGGARPGAGRKPGSATKRTREIADAAAAEGLSPLEYMLSLLRDPEQSAAVRFEAAKSAAPYVHPKLSAIEHSGGLSMNHEDALDELDGTRAGDTSPPEG